jgi:alpha-ketoglutarate-dependent taurine dioxygenase
MSQPVERTTGDDTREQALPLVIRPEAPGASLAEWASANGELVHEALSAHGALLFRDFAVPTAEAFERAAETICPQLFGEYGDLPREGVSGKVYGSTPYPHDQAILFHNESSHLHRWPMRIFFYCAIAAPKGGETPIVDCRRVYEMLRPEMRDTFSEKGLMYVRNYTRGLDVSWQEFFRTDDKAVVEEYCRSASIEFEWKPRGGLRTRQRCHAITRHPRTGEPVFFNQIALHHVSCLDPDVRQSLMMLFREEDVPRNVYYGDGTPIDDATVAEVRSTMDSAAASFRWHEGDVVALDNMLVAHSRNPYEGPRKIVVAMGDMFERAWLDSTDAARGAPATGTT